MLKNMCKIVKNAVYTYNLIIIRHYKRTKLLATIVYKPRFSFKYQYGAKLFKNVNIYLKTLTLICIIFGPM